MEHDTLVRYVRKCKTEIIEAGPQTHTDASSSGFRIPSTQSKICPCFRMINLFQFFIYNLNMYFVGEGQKFKSEPKRKKTDEEKRFKSKGRYFVAAQLVAVAVFLTLMISFDFAEVEVENVDDQG